MKDFNDFMTEVLNEFLGYCEDKETAAKGALWLMYGAEPDKGGLPTYQQMLLNVPAEDVYRKFLMESEELGSSFYKGHITEQMLKDAKYADWELNVPYLSSVVRKMLNESSRNVFGDDYGHSDFFEPMLDKMQEDITHNYITPYEFFTELKQGMYERKDAHSCYYERDLLDFYGDYSSSMEMFKEVAEKHLGERAKDDHWYEHYVWIYFLCFEEIGYHIARVLFNEDFKFEGEAH